MSRNEQPLRQEVVDIFAYPFENRVPRKSGGPELAPQGGEHAGEGRAVLMSVPGNFASHSDDVVLAMAMLEVPEHDEGIGGEDEHEVWLTAVWPFWPRGLGPGRFLGRGLPACGATSRSGGARVP